MDEAHFLHKKVIQNGPLAQLIIGGRVAMASTPPRVYPSPIQDILDGKHPVTGEPICVQVNLELTCAACKKLKHLENRPDIVCGHMAHLMPGYMDPDVLFTAKAAFGRDAEAFTIEMTGAAMPPQNNFLDEMPMKTLRDAARAEPGAPPRYIFVSCDPNGASRKAADGKQSAYAIVAFYVDNGRHVVLKGRPAP